MYMCTALVVGIISLFWKNIINSPPNQPQNTITFFKKRNKKQNKTMNSFQVKNKTIKVIFEELEIVFWLYLLMLYLL